ncbi:hypothetical protein FIU97_17400 [Roseivivax sp. THAF40]|nr:hypothetical protein FIV09_16990 [Roseivivax sp. THAF197b]QFT48364.1 hypothetical protein FIU97_17400 [Roseivivax sp. THAF40]
MTAGARRARDATKRVSNSSRAADEPGRAPHRSTGTPMIEGARARQQTGHHER